MNRFESLRFDSHHEGLANRASMLAQEVERFISELKPGRSSAMAVTKLEECHVWMGKAIRDDQIALSNTADTDKAMENLKAKLTNERWVK